MEKRENECVSMLNNTLTMRYMRRNKKCELFLFLVVFLFRWSPPPIIIIIIVVIISCEEMCTLYVRMTK